MNKFEQSIGNISDKTNCTIHEIFYVEDDNNLRKKIFIVNPFQPDITIRSVDIGMSKKVNKTINTLSHNNNEWSQNLQREKGPLR